MFVDGGRPMSAAGVVKALSEPRHRCFGCGGSCRGVRVRLLEGESERIAANAAALDIHDPIECSMLRAVDGACVFLDEAERCRLHAHFGASSKPLICQQYPLVVLKTEAETRVGIDPGCYNAWRTAPEDPSILTDSAVSIAVRLNPDQERAERAFLALAQSKTASVPGILSALCTGALDGELPAGLGSRIAERLKAMDLPALLAQPEAGRSLREALAPVARRVAELDPVLPPPYRVPPALDAHAVDVVRRMLFLRLQPNLPVQATALLTLTGAVAAAWTSTEMPVFGPALAAWTRALRAPPFWRALIPDETALHHLAVGNG
jgi:Fe-S-cluster containining protein